MFRKATILIVSKRSLRYFQIVVQRSTQVACVINEDNTILSTSSFPFRLAETVQVQVSIKLLNHVKVASVFNMIIILVPWKILTIAKRFQPQAEENKWGSWKSATTSFVAWWVPVPWSSRLFAIVTSFGEATLRFTDHVSV